MLTPEYPFKIMDSCVHTCFFSIYNPYNEPSCLSYSCPSRTCAGGAWGRRAAILVWSAVPSWQPQSGEDSSTQRGSLRSSSGSAAALHAQPAFFWNTPFLTDTNTRRRYRLEDCFFVFFLCPPLMFFYLARFPRQSVGGMVCVFSPESFPLQHGNCGV